MREVRFFHSPLSDRAARDDENHWAGTGPHCVLPFWTTRVVVEGDVDPHTGYLCDIKVLDDLVRRCVAMRLRRLSDASEFEVVGSASVEAFDEISLELRTPARLASLEVLFSPYTSLAVRRGAHPMLEVTQSFEFSASHRLACAGLSDEDNHRLFGKCSNPHGHGHNYILEVSVGAKSNGVSPALLELDRVVRREIVERFDHKNLNVECEDFARLNPTVENIAQVIFDRLTAVLTELPLTKVRVWETAKTYAECRCTSVRVGEGLR